MKIENFELGFYILAITLITSSCATETWTPLDDIDVEGISATGIALDGETFWLSDTDENKIVQLDFSGNEVSEINDIIRPMHLANHNGQLIVPEYMNDTIRTIDNKVVSGFLDILEAPDAPAAVDQKADKIIVADFYNNRIIYNDGGQNKTFGKKGKGPGEFLYPTDVQFANDKIYVADAYNHRVQVFDEEGNHINTFGEEENMNASTGIFVNEQYVVVTDFENDRLLTYDLNGKLVDIIDEGLHRPTDALISDGRLYVVNFKGQFIAVYK